MGTGSFRGGSGALGRSGSGAEYATLPGSGESKTSAQQFFAGRLGNRSEGPSEESARRLVRDLFAQRGVGSYLSKLLASPAVRGCYEELFLVSVVITLQRSWHPITRDYGIKDAPGCLAELARELVRKHTDEEPLEAYREIARSMVLDVLLAAVREDDDVFLEGRAKDVFAKIDPRVFKSLSGHCLGSVLYRAALRELPALDGREIGRIREATQERADYLIAKFEGRFYAKGQTTHRQLLQVFREHETWFLDKVWETIET